MQPTQVDPLRPEYRGLSSDLASYGTSLVGKPTDPYSGSFSAPMSSGESDILSRINSMYTGNMSSLPFGDQRSSLISDILSGKRLSPDSNPFLAKTIGAISDASNRALGNNLNMLDAAFGRNGILGPSSGRSVEATTASRNNSIDLNNTIAQILGQNYQQGTAEQMNTLGSILPNMDTFTANSLFSALGANALPRTIQQNDNMARYNEFIRQISAPGQNTQLAASILGAQPGFQYTNPTYQPMPFWQQALLGGISGAAQGGAAALMG